MSQPDGTARWRVLEPFLAASLFRAGLSSAAARHAKEILGNGPVAGWLDLVAARVWPDPGDRMRQVAWALTRASELAIQADARGFDLTCLADPDYPDLLTRIPDPPLLLWSHGDKTALRSPCVAIVGSRTATPASLAVARTLGRELAEAGLTIVSGLARGVDAAAHEGALDSGGRTVAVLGSGLSRIYPREHVDLASRLETRGALISELEPDANPAKAHFPLRNRLISGLSRAVVVIEASDRSGSLITARMALDQNRDVLAVPGGVLSGRHRGCHALIKDGARLVETVGDVLEELKWPGRPGLPAGGAHNHLQLSDLESNMAMGEAYTVDDLAGQMGQPASKLLADLCFLEIAGRVVRTPGGQFVRLEGPRGTKGT